MGRKIAVAAALAVAACGAAASQTVDGHFTICHEQRQPDCVVDGDTIQVDGVRIQLSDIDAPDTWRPACDAQQELGDRAARRLLELLNAGPFVLESREARDHDSYGRELRVATRDGHSLGDVLVQEGLARPWQGTREDWCR
jgi:endonuclease YncB( thermonuclease family)